MVLRHFLIVIVGFLLLSCSRQDIQGSILSDEVKAELDMLNNAVLSADKEALISATHPSVITENLESGIISALSFVPDGEVVKIDLASANFTAFISISGHSFKTYDVSYHLEFPDKWAMFSYRLIDEGEGLKVLSLHVSQSDISFKDVHAFTLRGKSPMHEGVLFWAIATIGFIIWTFIAAVREKNLKRRILWLIFIAVGVGGFSLNWTTGAWAFQTLNISLLGAGISSAGPYSPWILKVSFPLGAVLFWYFKKQGKLKYKPIEADK